MQQTDLDCGCVRHCWLCGGHETHKTVPAVLVSHPRKGGTSNYKNMLRVISEAGYLLALRGEKSIFQVG